MPTVMVTENMLVEFQGKVDRNGLRSFRQGGVSGNDVRSSNRLTNEITVWAVLEERDAAAIVRQCQSGLRRDALKMLELSAISLGSLNP